jgi:hypothetical protein
MNLFDFPSAIIATISQAISKGIKDPSNLADLVFYWHHPELRGSGIRKGMNNYDELSKEWLSYYDLFARKYGPVAPKPGDNSDRTSWRPYEKSNIDGIGFISSDIKAWASRPPKHKREVAAFVSNKMDGDRARLFIVWKTNDPRSHCKFHNVSENGSIHYWTEQPLDYNTIRQDHKLEVNWITYLGNDAGVKGIALMNFGLNVIIFDKTLKNGVCLSLARSAAKRALAEEAKQTYELMQSVVGGASGAKMAKPKNFGDLAWHSFGAQVKNVVENRFPRSVSPNVGSLHGIRFNDEIKDGSGKVIGWVNYFD